MTRFHCAGNQWEGKGCGLLSHSTQECKCQCDTCALGKTEMRRLRNARKSFVTSHAADIHIIILKESPHMLSIPALRAEAIRLSVEAADEFADSRGMLK